jgi:nitrate reductase (NAD(P)H)
MELTVRLDHLHFVRNHGAVPRVDEDALRNWTIRIYGLVEREVSFSIADLKANFDVVTLPVTLVCAGNRRKEQNVLRKSLGQAATESMSVLADLIL